MNDLNISKVNSQRLLNSSIAYDLLQHNLPPRAQAVPDAQASPKTNDASTNRLAVVVICKNQMWNIGRLIESVLEETRLLKSKEIVVVDSASTDDTVAIARRYDVNVVRLCPDQRLTAAAGRHVGYQHTDSEFILFLDGDMELCEGWLRSAMIFMHSHPDVAVISGHLIDLPKATKADDRLRLKPIPPSDMFNEVLHGGGAAMYRRSVLAEVGGFNPYLYSDEEPDLCVRIRYVGYRVIRLHQPIAYHYSDPTGKLSTLMGRWRRNLYLGAGQNIRQHLGSRMLWPYIRERGYGCIPAFGLLIGLFSFFWSLQSGQWLWFGLWLSLLLGITVIDICRKRSLYRTVASLLERLLIVDGTIRGFLLQPLDSARYSPEIEVIKTVRQGGAADPYTSTQELNQRLTSVVSGSLDFREYRQGD